MSLNLKDKQQLNRGAGCIRDYFRDNRLGDADVLVRVRNDEVEDVDVFYGDDGDLFQDEVAESEDNGQESLQFVDTVSVFDPANAKQPENS